MDQGRSSSVAMVAISEATLREIDLTVAAGISLYYEQLRANFSAFLVHIAKNRPKGTVS